MGKLFVLLATYNGELYVRQQIESILNQSYTDFVLAVRDDGSRDKTLDIISELSRKDDRLVIIEDDQVNVGASKNFEILINFALQNGATYLAFSDQDDVWNSGKLAGLMADISRYDDIPALVHSDLVVVDAKLDVIHESFMQYQGIRDMGDQGYHVLPVQNYVTGCTMLINEKLARLALPIPCAAVMHDWWIALYAAYFGKIIFNQKRFVLYRQHGYNEIGAKRYYNALLKLIRMLAYKNEQITAFRNIQASLAQASEFYSRLNKQDQCTADGKITLLGEYISALSGEHGIASSIRILRRSGIHRIDLYGTFWLYIVVVFYRKQLKC